MGDDYAKALVEKIHEWTYDVLNDDAKLSAWKNKIDTAFDEEFPVRNVDEFIREKAKEKALDELFSGTPE